MGMETHVKEYIEEKILVWYGHVQKAQNMWINKVIEWSPLGRRKMGRLGRSCRNEVDVSMEHRELEEGQWKHREN